MIFRRTDPLSLATLHCAYHYKVSGAVKTRNGSLHAIIPALAGLLESSLGWTSSHLALIAWMLFSLQTELLYGLDVSLVIFLEKQVDSSIRGHPWESLAIYAD